MSNTYTLFPLELEHNLEKIEMLCFPQNSQGEELPSLFATLFALKTTGLAGYNNYWRKIIFQDRWLPTGLSGNNAIVYIPSEHVAETLCPSWQVFCCSSKSPGNDQFYRDGLKDSFLHVLQTEIELGNCLVFIWYMVLEFLK